VTPAHLLRHAGLVPASTGPQTVGTLDTRPGMTLCVGLALAFTTPATAQTQAQMNDTARADYDKADAAMNAQWKTTYAAMKARDTRNTSRGGGFGYAAATLASQRAWLAFRDRQCTIEAGQYNGGTMAPMVRASCLTRLTKERTVQLRDLNWNN
jgi:uncharacterized protein YecT (DUF1311 family)